jgi:hypothetical protein
MTNDEKKDEDSKETLTAVFTTWDNVEAGFIQSLLQANGIECVRQNLHYASIALVGSSAAPIRVLVQTKDKERAEDIVNQYYQDIKEEKDKKE